MKISFVSLTHKEALLIYQGIARLEFENYKKLYEFEKFVVEKNPSFSTKQCIELKKIDICSELLCLKSLSDKVTISSMKSGIASLLQRDLEMIIKSIDHISDDYCYCFKKKILLELQKMKF